MFVIKNVIILNQFSICCMAFPAKYVFLHVNHTVVERNCSEELSLRSPVNRKHKSCTVKVLKAKINLLYGVAVLGSGCSTQVDDQRDTNKEMLSLITSALYPLKIPHLCL